MADGMSDPNQPYQSTTVPSHTGRNIIIGVIVLLVILGAIAFFWRGSITKQAVLSTDEPDVVGDDQADLGAPVVGTPDPSLATSPAASVVPAKEFAVTATSFKFTPAEMKVKQGDVVRVVVKNDSSAPHDLKLDEFFVGTSVLQQGQEETVEFVASKTGTFEYYCSVGNHRQMGMVGKLIVE